VGATNALAGLVVVLDPLDSGAVSFNGTTVVALGGLEGSRDLSLLNDLSATQDLTLGSAGSGSYTGKITGVKSIRKVGAGTQTYDPGSLTTSLVGLNVSGGTLELNSGNFTVTGNAGPGAPDSTSGFIVSRGGTFRMNGANVTTTGGSYVIPAGNTLGGGNNFILDSGTFDGGSREVLNAYGASGTFTINDGLFIGGEFRISQSATGIVNLNGGTLRVTNLKYSNADAIVNLDGGTLQAKADRADFITTSVTQANIREGGAIIDSNGFNITIPKVMTEDPGSTGGGLTKIGTGSLTLSAANTYTGPTLVNEGSLIVNADHSGATGAVSVGDGTGSINSAILGGTGPISGNVTLADDGAIAPGTSVGNLGVLGNISGTGSLLVQIDGATADKLIVGGTLNISTMKLDVSELSAPSESVYVIVDASSAITGAAFAAVTGIPSGYTLTYNYNDGVDTHNIALVFSGGSPFQTWAGAAAYTDDANGDGVDNGLAWILGAANKDVSALNKLPAAAVSGGFLTLNFTRVSPYAPAKLYVEYGNNLVGWTKLEIPAASGTIGGDIEVVVSAGSPNPVQVKIPTTHAAGGKLFTRLSSTEN
jgi:autotransporter-associated beta strand protein